MNHRIGFPLAAAVTVAVASVTGAGCEHRSRSYDEARDVEVAAAPGEAATDDSAPDPAATATDEAAAEPPDEAAPSCEEIAERFHAIRTRSLAARGDLAPQQRQLADKTITAQRQSFLSRCQNESWPAEVRACIGDAKTDQDVAACQKGGGEGCEDTAEAWVALSLQAPGAGADEATRKRFEQVKANMTRQTVLRCKAERWSDAVRSCIEDAETAGAAQRCLVVAGDDEGEGEGEGEAAAGDASCQAAVAKMIALNRAEAEKKIQDEQQRAQFVAMLAQAQQRAVQQCENDKWPQAMRACAVAAESMADLEKCRQLQ